LEPNNQRREEDAIMKKTYENPELTVQVYEVEDVITDNGAGENETSFRG
jgi:hypothetical protein